MNQIEPYSLHFNLVIHYLYNGHNKQSSKSLNIFISLSETRHDYALYAI